MHPLVSRPSFCFCFTFFPLSIRLSFHQSIIPSVIHPSIHPFIDQAALLVHPDALDLVRAAMVRFPASQVTLQGSRLLNLVEFAQKVHFAPFPFLSSLLFVRLDFALMPFDT
jgi:hypothetical protein